MVNVTFLGTADAIPSYRRNSLSVLLNYDKENILFDCGEGTQRQFRKARLNPCKVTRILISHWHGDHVLGLPGLMATLSFSGYNKTLFIYGPKGIKEFISGVFKLYRFKVNYEVKVEEVSGNFLDTKDFSLSAEKMDHGIPCNAYCFIKKGKRRIYKDKLKKAKLPSGPLLQKLKEGKNISYGKKKYLVKDLTYKEEDKKVCFVVDTRMNKKIVPFVKNSNLLICETTFGKDLVSDAKEKGHLTSVQAGEIAKKSKVKKLVITHVGSRYDKDVDFILKETKKVFKNSVLVKDLDSLEV